MKAAEAAVNVSLARIGDGANVLRPLRADLREFLEQIFPWKPLPFLFKQCRAGIVDVLPVALAIHDLDHHVVSHGHADARIVKVTRIHHHWLSALLGLEGAQRRQHVLHRAVSLKQMHVFNAPELALQRGGKNDNRDLGTRLSQLFGYVSPEFPRTQMVVEHGNINCLELLFGGFDGRGSQHLVTFFTQDRGPQNQVFFAIVEQKYANRSFALALSLDGGNGLFFAHGEIANLFVALLFVFRIVLIFTAYRFSKLRQFIKKRNAAQPLLVFDGRRPAHHLTRGHVFQDAPLRSDHNPTPNAPLPGPPPLPATHPLAPHFHLPTPPPPPSPPPL